jgi:sigma-B regulation protein RsbU (phosphoserine phosphatase)
MMTQSHALPSLERIRRHILFENVDDEQFSRLTGKLSVRKFAAGDVIMEDESEGEHLFLLVEGRVKIVKRTRAGDDKLLAFLHPGDFFGELELVDGRPRSARVVAFDDCLAIVLHKNEFDRLLEESHAFTLRLLQVLSLRLRATNNHFISELERNAARWKLELHKLERLLEATKVVNSTLDLDKLLRVILETALRIVDGDRGTVYLVDEGRNELWSKVLQGSERVKIRLAMGKGIAGYVGATGDTLNIPDAYLDPRFNPAVDRKTGYKTKTILCMPMKDKDEKIIGVFQLLNKRHGLFTGEDEHFIAALSVHAAIAIENARLYEQERQKAALEKELIAAREVQMSLLPKTLPAAEGYQFAAASLPAKEVAGDLYDFMNMESGRIALLLGDVSGKGLPAALLMANLQGTLRDQTFLNFSPRDCLSNSNTLLHHNTSPEKFVTLFYAILDTARHDVRYANAGQDHPFLIRPDGSADRLKEGGIPLGVLSQFPYGEASIRFEPGSVLVICSDGISEAVNRKEEQFGEERLGAFLREHRHQSAEELLNGVLSAVKQHIGNTPQFDDITIVVVKRAAS